MISGIGEPCLTATQRAAEAERTAWEKKEPKAKSGALTEDTVDLSPAGLAALKAEKAESAEATETYAETLKKALAGDPKAQAKLDKNDAEQAPGEATI